MYFIFDPRLGIHIPSLSDPWSDLTKDQQKEIIYTWEDIRGEIPDRIKILETSINEKQERLNQEDDFNVSCQLNQEISELASIINDLWLWFRASPAVQE
ncbi:gas vesicle protein [Bacillus ectoiniformans]|uniref:hypothetical protein n=1 Tax=Bacillus ectoiniformans TaxID=1494429 RepID=UPI0019584060|nr:hypothetical protein [Bacillus ectoiniformans]MBM7648824.1 gas vesicle protein [Bacillus ectoiniformans]